MNLYKNIVSHIPIYDRFTYIDLFCGIGGFREAMDSLGMTCVFSCDKDKYARKVYKDNFGDEPHGDITAIPCGDIPFAHMIVGGFPCQPFSLAGERKGAEDKRDMTSEVLRVLRCKQPMFFLLENVPGLKTISNGEYFKEVMRKLGDLGPYNICSTVLSSKAYVPQKRNRLFIFGTRMDVGDMNTWPVRAMMNYPIARPKLKNILEKEVSEEHTLTNPTWIYYKNRTKFRHKIVGPDEQAGTLVSTYYKNGHTILIGQKGKNPRKLTVRECARLMGFPDSFKFDVSRSQGYRLLGNSVVVPLIADIVSKAVCGVSAHLCRRRL